MTLGGRVYHRIVAARARHIVAGVCLIVGLARLGLLSSGPTTTLPGAVYGGLLVAAALALLGTAGAWRSRVLGRGLAGLTACVLAGLATDFWLTLHGVTTSLILLWLALWLFWEAVAEHDC